MRYNLKSYGIDASNAKRVEGQNALRTTCPHCSASRSTTAHQRERVLYVNLDNGCCHCHHCGADWRMDSEEYLARREKARQLALAPSSFVRPKQPASWPSIVSAYAFAPTSTLAAAPSASPATPDVDPQPLVVDPQPLVVDPQPLDADYAKLFSSATLKYLTETRGLPVSVLRRAAVSEQLELMPQTQAKERCIVFNYLEQGFLVNQKFRSAKKHFKMVHGAELIPYLIDSCLGHDEVIVTEGEMDALSFLAAGFESVVSVPSGANANADWMNRFYDLYFSDKQCVYIATDMDAPGQLAAEELVRRFGPEVCRRVRFSAGCKDANDELVHHGADALRRCISQAEEVPMKDISLLTDFEEELDAFYQNGPQPGALTGWWNLDRVVSFGTGQLALVTGRSNDGKSEWTDELVLRLMLRTGWNAGFWTPENSLMDHCRKVIEKLTDRGFVHQGTRGVQPQQFALCKQWMARHLSWLDLPFDRLRLDVILERCRSMVRKYGIRILVLDPFNFIEKENNSTRSENAWDSHVVGAVREFARRHDVLVFLVAHPRKVEMQIDGRKRRITMEDISGTADFGNKADYCFCVDRDDEHHLVTISIDKVRFKQYGSKGQQVHYVYKSHSGRYVPCHVDENRNPKDADYAADGGMWPISSI